MTDGEKAAYLAAFIDGEGHIGLSVIKKTGCFTREITCNNTDKALIDAVAQMFRDLNFSIAMYHMNRNFPNQPQWKIRLGANKATFERFLRIIPLQCPRKVTVLKQLIDSYRNPAAVRDQRRNGVEKACAQCGELYYRPPSVRGQFCSKACSEKASVRRISKVCQVCGKHYEVIQAKKLSKYCSLVCSGKAQSERLSLMGRLTIANARAHRQPPK